VVKIAHPKSGYKNFSGKKVPGVTTIIGRFKDSGGLLYWAFEQGKAAERGEIERLYDLRDSAAQAGTLCHSMVEAHIRGEPFPDVKGIPLAITAQAQQGYDNYMTWAKNNKMEVTDQEVALVSERYQYGGCLDCIMVDGERALGDWKTSNAIYQDHLIQLAAYKELWEENYPDKPITGGFHLCRFSKKHGDFAHHYWSELDDAWEQFKLFRKAYELDKKIKKRV